MTDKEFPNDDLTDDLSEAEKRSLAALAKDKLPPAELEERIVAELRSKQLITSSSVTRWTGVLRYVSAAAAAVLIFALGMEIGARRASLSGDGASSSGARQFMLLLFETPGVFQALPPERANEQVTEYVNWARSVAMSGVNISGEKLKEEGRTLFAGSEGMQISAIPAASEGRSLAGYFAIEAEDFEQALKISSSCPHLKYGGEIELREIDQNTESITH